MHRIQILTAQAFLACALAACGGGSGDAVVGPTLQDDPALSSLSDDFTDPTTLSDWSRVAVVEQWGFDQLEVFDVATTRPGWLTMIPYSSGWYEDYRGVQAYKLVTGDFMVTAHLEVSNRAGSGAPGQLYSLAGIMVRAPRNVTPQTWQPGGENYVFLSLGAASNPGTFQTEVKTTTNSVSVLEIENALSGVATIRTARIGNAVIVLIRPGGGSWTIHRRYRRADLPAELAVGLTTYTDWNTVQALTPVEHNTALITGGTPDLIAQFDYVNFAVPAVPVALASLDLTNPAVVSDAELLAFLGQ